MVSGQSAVSVDEASAVGMLDAAAAAFPKELDKAVGRAASILKRQVRAALRGRSKIAPARRLDIVTVMLHGDRQMGGALADNMGVRVKRAGRYARSVAPAQYLESLFDLWQGGGSTGAGSAETRHMLYVRLGRFGQQGLVKSMPEKYEGRPIIPAITENARPLFVSWIAGALKGALNKGK